MNKSIVEDGHKQIKLVQQLTQCKSLKELPKFSNEALGERIVKHTVNLLSRYDLNRNNVF